MTKKSWHITIEEESFDVEVSLWGFCGKLIVKIGEDEFPLPNKFLTILFGRKENFKLGDYPAILDIKPFCKITVITKNGIYN